MNGDSGSESNPSDDDLPDYQLAKLLPKSAINLTEKIKIKSPSSSSKKTEIYCVLQYLKTKNTDTQKPRLRSSGVTPKRVTTPIKSNAFVVQNCIEYPLQNPLQNPIQNPIQNPVQKNRVANNVVLNKAFNIGTFYPLDPKEINKIPKFNLRSSNLFANLRNQQNIRKKTGKKQIRSENTSPIRGEMAQTERLINFQKKSYPDRIQTHPDEAFDLVTQRVAKLKQTISTETNPENTNFKQNFVTEPILLNNYQTFANKEDSTVNRRGKKPARYQSTENRPRTANRVRENEDSHLLKVSVQELQNIASFVNEIKDEQKISDEHARTEKATVIRPKSQGTRRLPTPILKMRTVAEEIGDLRFRGDSQIIKPKIHAIIKERRSANLRQSDNIIEDNPLISARQNNVTEFYQLFLKSKNLMDVETKLASGNTSTQAKRIDISTYNNLNYSQDTARKPEQDFSNQGMNTEVCATKYNTISFEKSAKRSISQESKLATIAPHTDILKFGKTLQISEFLKSYKSYNGEA